MSETLLGAVASEQRVSTRLALPYLRGTTAVGLNSSYLLKVLPIKPIDANDKIFTFEIPRMESSLIDLRATQLYVRGRILKVDAASGATSPVTGGVKVLLINNSLHSLWESVTVHMGTNQCEYFSGQFAMKSYLKTLLLYKEKHASSGSLVGFNFEMDNVGEDVNNAITRKKVFLNSAFCEFLGPTLIDPFETEGLLQSGVGIRLTYSRSEPPFYLVVEDSQKDEKFKFDIVRLELHVQVLRVNSDLLPYMADLCASSPARYHFTSVLSRQFNIQKDTLTFEVGRLFSEHVPQRMIVSFHESAQYLGTNVTTPYFTSSSIVIKSLKLHHNGLIVRELRPDFENTSYASTYKAFIDFVDVTTKNYMMGKCLLIVIYISKLYIKKCV